MAEGIFGRAMTGRQTEKASLFQFEQQRATSHVLVASAQSTPIPVEAQRPGQACTVPGGVLFHPLTNQAKIFRRNGAPLDRHEIYCSKTRPMSPDKNSVRFQPKRDKDVGNAKPARGEGTLARRIVQRAEFFVGSMLIS